MKAQLLLADAAKADPGSSKVHALGLGWSVTSSPTPAMALVLLLKVAWTECNRPLAIHIWLETEDGKVVRVPGPAGPLSLDLRASGEAGRPAGLPEGSAVDMSLAFGLGSGLPLPAGARYLWKAEIKDEGQDSVLGEDSVSFYVRPTPRRKGRDGAQAS